MPIRSRFPFLSLSIPRVIGRVLFCSVLFCGILAAMLGGWARPSATAAHAATNDSAASDTLLDGTPQDGTILDPGDNAPRPFASYIIQLEAEPVAVFYAALLADGEVQAASITALTQAHLASVESAQAQLVATLASHDAQVIYRVQRVLNGVAIYAPTDQLAAIRALPGVQSVDLLIPKTPTNARVNELLHAPAIWEGIDRAGLTGEGVSIAVIDTGLDYLHTMFGGPGTGYLANDTNIVGDAANFPSVKVVGGYDFAGDTYDASPTSFNYQPIPEPDPDPMDCYGFGHGTHVAGTAAGYGVRMNGTTYPGPFDSTIGLSTLRIGPGVAPKAQLYALKVFGCTGSSNIVDEALEWAVDPNQDGDFSDHVDVINMSLGSNFGSTIDSTTIAAENAARLGIIVVASAGNSGDVHYAVGSPGMASRAIAVAATSIDSSDPNDFVDGTVASFSSRGPRRGDDILKPDISAPGVNVVSARRGTGTQSVTSSGTSMASPVVAGIMALLRQAHPAADTPLWRNRDLKALAMNTAIYPVIRPDIAGPYSLVRVGAGRIDPTTALQSQLLAYDAAAPEQVSVSFGLVEVLDRTTVVRAIRLANKSATAISVTVAYTPVSALPGVTIDVGVSKTITVPALGFATSSVTLTVDASALARQPDPARQLTPVNAHPWVDEASGYVSFTPVITTSGPAIHVPILALPRMISAVTAVAAPIDLGSTLTATFPLTITGSVITDVAAPTQTVPMLGVFGLAHSSPPAIESSDGEPLLGRYDQADLRYVGIAGPMLVEGERVIYFALVSYGPWATPLEVTYQIAIDINNDDLADYGLQNREATDISTFDFATSDEFVSMLETIGGGRSVQGPLNVFLPTQYDTRPFDSNVMILPLYVDELGVNVKTFRYQVTSSSRDLSDTQNTGYVDVSPIMTFPLDQGTGIVASSGAGMDEPLFPTMLGDEVHLTFDRAAYIKQQTKGVLLLYLHNEFDARTQVLPVQFDWDNALYLPGIHGK